MKIRCLLFGIILRQQSIQEWTKCNLWKTAYKKYVIFVTHWVPVLPTNQLTGFYMRVTLALNGLSRPYLFKFFKGCFPQILLGLFSYTLSRITSFHVSWSVQYSFQTLNIRSYIVTYCFCKSEIKITSFKENFQHVLVMLMHQHISQDMHIGYSPQLFTARLVIY